LSGVAIFFANQQNKRLYIRLAELETAVAFFTHELYENFELKKLNSYFYCFESDDCIYGFSFACENEGTKFCNSIVDWIKKSEYKLRPGKFRKAYRRIANFTTRSKQKNNDLELSRPTSFVHKAHFGANLEETIIPADWLKANPEWEQFYQNIGVQTNVDLEDESVVRAIIEITAKFFIENNAAQDAQPVIPESTPAQEKGDRKSLTSSQEIKSNKHQFVVEEKKMEENVNVNNENEEKKDIEIEEKKR